MIPQLMRLRSNSWRRLKLRRTQAKTKWDWPVEVDKGILDAKLCYLGTSLPNILDSSQSKSFMQFSQEVEALKTWTESASMDCYYKKFQTTETHGVTFQLCYCIIFISFFHVWLMAKTLHKDIYDHSEKLIIMLWL